MVCLSLSIFDKLSADIISATDFELMNIFLVKIYGNVFLRGNFISLYIFIIWKMYETINEHFVYLDNKTITQQTKNVGTEFQIVTTDCK